MGDDVEKEAESLSSFSEHEHNYLMPSANSYDEQYQRSWEV